MNYDSSPQLDSIKKFIRSYELEEGGCLDPVESRLAHSSIIWAEWNGRKLVMLEIDASEFEPVGVAFSLDLAPYEIADFSRKLEATIGEWYPISSFFMAEPLEDGSDRIIQGDRATTYKAFRDCGLIGGGSQ